MGGTMPDLTKFFLTQPGLVLLGVCTVVLLAFVFRGPLSGLIDRLTKAEISKKSIKIEAKTNIPQGRMHSPDGGLSESNKQASVDFGERNEFSGDWSNVAIGGNVTSPGSQTPEVPSPTTKKKP
jgi:hypothetical protein